MMSETTEKSILDNIPDLMDTGDDAAETSNTTTESQTPEGSAPSSNDDGGTANTATQGGEARQPNASQPTAHTTIQRKDGYIEVPSKTTPNARDIVDPKTGEVIAKGGTERRHFEAAQRATYNEQIAQRRAQQFEQRAIRAEAVAQQATDITTAVQAAGIDHATHKLGVELMGRFLKDPVSVLTDLVIEVKSKGYNIPFLEQGVTPGMDAAAMTRALDQRMAPITQAQQHNEQQQQIQQQAKQTLDNFLAAEPDAVHNISIIGEMLTQDRSLTLERAYLKLSQMAWAVGLDPTQPLKPQYEAAQRQQTQQPANPAQTTQPSQRPLPNGRQTNVAVPVAQARQFDENSNMGDIIRHAMKETGYSP